VHASRESNVNIGLRPIEAGEFAAFMRADASSFGIHVTDADVEQDRPYFELDRSLAAIDDGQIVGTGAILSFDLTVPGRRSLPAAGVTWISVLPTHRRRGILSAIMRRQLSDVRERGEPLAILWASESIIYGRYGYGVATTHADYRIDTRHGGFAQDPEAAGRVRLLDKAAAAEVLPEIYERFRLLQPGALTRPREYWNHYMIDPERWRDGASARFYAVHESDSGVADGFVTYRIKDKWENAFPESRLLVTQLISVTSEARLALWKFCLELDLIAVVEAGSLPADESIRWMLADFRRLRIVNVPDSLWLRLVDIPAALAARGYSTADRLVFGVTDRFCPENSGNYELEGSPQGGQCNKTSASPDLTLEVADLSATYLGGVRFGTLSRAFRVRENTPGALQRADLMFSSEVTPWCSQEF
jgi:predicted acetyltransferase